MGNTIYNTEHYSLSSIQGTSGPRKVSFLSLSTSTYIYCKITYFREYENI
jgi:hypothetical protein